VLRIIWPLTDIGVSPTTCGLAKRLRSTVRNEDMVIRWGVEEFLVYAPKVHAQHLQSLAQQVLKVVCEV
jgi:GGDEF domain-containing protein